MSVSEAEWEKQIKFNLIHRKTTRPQAIHKEIDKVEENENDLRKNEATGVDIVWMSGRQYCLQGLD